ncbi:MAG: methylenetetrahydrofolate reductase [NAD(P)H] [Planctomycetes bacterium]|nr:methylenetetrahydrofolate reductase [NAD(P)H] [Planctomycetota bacterium]
MRIGDLHRQQRLVVSFELFPPKTPEAEVKLLEEAIPGLLALKPAFMTCTYGAGGSTRTQTLEIVSRIRREFEIEAVSHLTCVGSSREDLARYLEAARAADINNIVALRGDPPRGDETFRPHPDGFKYADELVAFVKAAGGFDVAVAGYPEGHPECPDKHLDWRRCADKVAAGADVVITQLFYDNADFFGFRDHLRDKLHVTVPIVAGILPILSKQQIERFCGLCGSKIPPEVQVQLDKHADDHAACRRYGVELATRMCEDLIRNGVAGLHFYTLNRVASTAEVMRNLGLA